MKQVTRAWILAATAVCMAVSACGSSSSTAAGGTAAPDNLTVMVGGLAKQIYLPNMLAKQLGYFSAENINVTLVDEGSGQGSEQEVVAGNVDAGSGAYNHTIQLQAAGKQIETVCQFGIAPGEAEMLRTDLASTVSSAKGLKGRNLGVTDIGSGTQTLTEALLGKTGVSPTDASYVAVGAGDTFIAALQQKRIDAGMTTEPTISRLVSTGAAKVLVDLRTPESTRAALGGDYPFIGIFMRNDYVASHRDVTQRLVNAYVKTLKWIHSHSAAEIAAKMPSDYYAGNQALYVQALQNQLSIFGTDCKMPPSGPETVLQVLQQYTDFKGKTATLPQTYTNEFADKAS